MKQQAHISILLAMLLVAAANLSAADPHFSLTEVSVFHERYFSFSKTLEMGYASYVIKNPEAWQNTKKDKRVYQVDIVFTRYPYHKEDWITHYDTLLENRMRAVCALEPSIDRSAVTWNLILQTDCRTEAEAQKLFHGVVLWYVETPVKNAGLEQLKPFTKDIEKPEEQPPVKDIDILMSGTYEFSDSAVFQVLERNAQWRNMLIVGDWTSSMYSYGAQAVLWHQLNMEKKKVSQFVFFNDGNRKRHKPIGKTGGIYVASPKNIGHIIEVMKKVQDNGDGGDTPENDIEALLKASSKTKYFEELILIADNNSSVKDMALLKELKIPVRVIVCGLKKGQTIHHDYLQIASATKGSVHTVEEDIWDLSKLKEGERVTIMSVPYQRTHGRIIKSRFPNYPKEIKARL